MTDKGFAHTVLYDLTAAVVVCPPGLSGREQKAVSMLIEEVEKRTLIAWRRTQEWPEDSVPMIIVGSAAALASFAGSFKEFAGEGSTSAREGYRIRVRSNDGRPVVWIIGNDERGVLFGVGRLLRSLRMQPIYMGEPGRIALPADLDITTAPRYRLRGWGFGYGDMNNTYCGWDLPQWEQYFRDLAIFGGNAVRLTPARWDETRRESVHFPMPPRRMVPALSRIADEYGIDFWLSCSPLDGDYSDPAVVEHALEKYAEAFAEIPRIDAMHVKGGDPGHTEPKQLIPLVGKMTAILRRHHPQAQMWISPQGFTQEWMDQFLDILQRERLDWLTGVVHGPWVHMTTAQFRELVPRRFAIRNFPDPTHCLSCQFPMPDWDIAYALTEGREPINPRPYGQKVIFEQTEPSTIGHILYSEGCHDDVNKAVWSALGWDPDGDVAEVLREYSRYFIGEAYADSFAQGLFALERNWQGPLATNSGVYTTLQQFQALEETASPQVLKKWRFQQALYRAYYDAYVRSRLLYETGLEEQAMALLREARERGVLPVMAEAERILERAVIEPISRGWRTRIHQLAEALFQSIHMQLSVQLYQGQEEVRGANLDGIDYPLNNRDWLKARFAEIRQLDNEGERLKAIDEVVQWENPGPGGFYDGLGYAYNRPHLLRGAGFEQDPGFLVSPLRRFPYRKDQRPLRLAWRGYTGMLNDATLHMRYTDLDPEGQYRVRVVYFAEPREGRPDVKIRLDTEEGMEIHPYMARPWPPSKPLEFDIPPEALRDGTLELVWRREQGKGGSGVGCDISEVWLVRK